MQRWWLAIALAAALSGCGPKPPPEPGETDPSVAVMPDEPPVESIEAAAVTVYFADSDLNYLEAEVIDAPSSASDPIELAKAALGALFAGPTETAHVRVLPDKLALRGLTVEDGVATVDLSQALLTDFQGGSGVASLAIYSIVNTVCAVEGLTAVRILVEGQPVGDFAGVLSLAEPLQADLSLVGGKPL